MSASKRKGTAWESAIVDYLRGAGWRHAERRATAGAHDRGDVAGLPGVVIEAKNEARIDLPGWLREAEAERVNDGADIGVVWAKRRGSASAALGYVVMTGEQFVTLLRSAGYGPTIAAPAGGGPGDGAPSVAAPAGAVPLPLGGA